MKRIIIQIESYELDDFKAHKDEMKDYALLVLLITRKLINFPHKKAENIDTVSKPFLMMDISKHSRAFLFIANNKYFCISYPLTIKIDNDKIKIYSTEKSIELTNQVISECIGVINSLAKNGNFIDAWMNDDGSNSQNSLDILELLLHTEPSYLRYDYDPVTAKGKESKHPAYHLDINMSKKGKYKLGLYEYLSPIDFINIINEDKDCHFLSKYNQILSLKIQKNKKKNTRRKNSKH